MKETTVNWTADCDGELAKRVYARVKEKEIQTERKNSLNTQVGGNHYTSMKIQPMEYSLANNLNACQHTAIKYISRYQQKNGVEDLEKAIHTLQLLIDWEKSNE